jgi:hypothetical protein
MKKKGTAAKKTSGHVGNEPPAIPMSPQSQMVPSTSPELSTITSTLGSLDSTINPARRLPEGVNPAVALDETGGDDVAKLRSLRSEVF